MHPVDFGELTFPATSQDYQFGCTYQGVPFTSTAYERDRGYYFEWQYQDGNAHGRWHAISESSKQLLYEEFYRNGHYEGESRYWYGSGKPERVDVYRNGSFWCGQRWNEQGVLVKCFDRENGIRREYYDDGSLLEEWKNMDKTKELYRQQPVIITYYPSGEWLSERLSYDEQKQRYHCRFNTELLLRVTPELNPTLHHLVVAWFIRHLIDTRSPLTLPYLCALSQHKEAYFRHEAAFFLGELKAKAGIPFLRQLLHDNAEPARRERFGFGGSSSVYTVGQRARKALQQIAPFQSFFTRWF